MTNNVSLRINQELNNRIEDFINKTNNKFSFSDIIGGALNFVNESNLIVADCENNYNFSTEVLIEKHCDPKTKTAISILLNSKKTQCQIEIISEELTALIPKGCAIEYIPPNIIAINVLKDIKIHFDINFNIEINFYNKRTEELMDCIESLNLSKCKCKINL